VTDSYERHDYRPENTVKRLSARNDPVLSAKFLADVFKNVGGRSIGRRQLIAAQSDPESGLPASSTRCGSQKASYLCFDRLTQSFGNHKINLTSGPLSSRPINWGRTKQVRPDRTSRCENEEGMRQTDMAERANQEETLKFCRTIGEKLCHLG